MNWVEKFFLATGAVGLLADATAIITFIAGFWKINPQETPSAVNGEMPLIFQILTGVFLLYGWITISAFLVIRAARIIGASKLRAREKERKTRWNIFYTNLGVSILLLPLVIAWFSITLEDEKNRQLTEVEGRKSIHATMTVMALEKPIPEFTRMPIATTENGTVVPTVVSPVSTGRDYVDLSIYWVPFIFLEFPLVTFAIFIVELLLLPVIYPDLFSLFDVPLQ